MQSSKLPLLTTGVSPLIHAYLSGDPKLDVLHQGMPSIQQIHSLSKNRSFDGAHRELLVSSIRAQYGKQLLHEKVRENLSTLALPNSRTVTTGHQLCLSMGPFYMISKVCSAIALANKLNRTEGGFSYVPVFWMATEDHDFDEINHLHLFGKKVEWSREKGGAVGHMSTSGITQAIALMGEILGADFDNSDLKNVIEEAYHEANLALATRHLFNALFGEHGLLIVDGDSHDLKTLFQPVVKKELIDNFSKNAIHESSKVIKSSGYKTQINSREINLFYLSEGYRNRIISREDGFATADGEHTWTKHEILDLVEMSPESFSPNVALRPVYQELILPNVAYIGGGGEIAYWLQLKGVFDELNLAFPTLVVRESTLLLNRGILKKIDSLGLRPDQLFKPTQEVIKSLLSSELPDWNKLEEGIRNAWSQVQLALDSVDPTLSKSAASEKAKSSGTMKALQAKALRASKEKNEAQVRKLEAIRNWVYPEGTLQERYVNILQFGSEQVRPIIDFLIQEFEPGQANMHVISFD